MPENNIEVKRQQSDHDLLIRIDTRLSDLIRDNNDFKTRLSKVEENKCDKDDMSQKIGKQDEIIDTKIKDHEARVRKLEKFVYVASGVIVVIQFILNKA
jgi:hypothetical protein